MIFAAIVCIAVTHIHHFVLCNYALCLYLVVSQLPERHGNDTFIKNIGSN